LKPSLSVVATSRNDDHGANLLSRMQLFVDGLAEQAERFGYPVELIVVEWNPPTDHPSLSKALRWEASTHFRPRIITAPPELHSSYPNGDRIPLFQMIAKNVGIRRAAAPFILATNIDILLSDELFAFFGDGLRPNAMYRADRRDVTPSFEQQPPPTPAECRALPPLRLHGLDRSRYQGGSRGRTLTAWPRLSELPRLAVGAWYRVVLPKLHTSGCGDFTLTSREVWDSIRGYPEWPIFSWHLDGLPLFQAYADGVEMVNLTDPMVAIHLEHSAGSGWTPEGSQALFSRLDARGVPYLTTNQYKKLARRIVVEKARARPINGPDWGLAFRDLAETTPSGGVIA